MNDPGRYCFGEYLLFQVFPEKLTGLETMAVFSYSFSVFNYDFTSSQGYNEQQY